VSFLRKLKASWSSLKANQMVLKSLVSFQTSMNFLGSSTLRIPINPQLFNPQSTQNPASPFNHRINQNPFSDSSTFPLPSLPNPPRHLHPLKTNLKFPSSQRSTPPILFTLPETQLNPLFTSSTDVRLHIANKASISRSTITSC
jgi:hypothetical protein